MMRACINYIHVSIPTLVEALIFFSSKGVDFFFKERVLCVGKKFFINRACNSTHVLMIKGVRFSSQVLALSLKVQGNKVRHTVSLVAVPSLFV